MGKFDSKFLSEVLLLKVVRNDVNMRSAGNLACIVFYFLLISLALNLYMFSLKSPDDYILFVSVIRFHLLRFSYLRKPLMVRYGINYSTDFRILIRAAWKHLSCSSLLLQICSFLWIDNVLVAILFKTRYFPELQCVSSHSIQHREY